MTSWLCNDMTSWLCNNMTSWLVNNMTSWLVNNMTSWLCNKMTSWLCNNMTSWLWNNMTSWSCNNMTSWSCNNMTSWLVNNMASCRFPPSCRGTSGSRRPSTTRWRRWSPWWCPTWPRSTKTTWTPPATPTTAWPSSSRWGSLQHQLVYRYLGWFRSTIRVCVKRIHCKILTEVHRGHRGFCFCRWHGLCLCCSGVSLWWTEASSSSRSTTTFTASCPVTPR